jgi:hypothetical protein
MQRKPTSVSTAALAAFVSLLFQAGGAHATASLPLSEEETDKALEAIWTKAPAPGERSPESAKNAALEAYLKRLGPGTAIVNGPPKEPSETDFAPLKFHSEVLPGNTGYIRLGALNVEVTGRLEPFLRDLNQINARNLILDLRATPPQGTLETAAAVASCLLPKGTPLFTLRTSSRTEECVVTKTGPEANFRILVLTGTRTGGPAEAIAAALKVHGDAMFIGARTLGGAADFELVPIGKQRFLRMPVKEVVIPSMPGLFEKGLFPDIPTGASGEATDAALERAAQDGRVSHLLVETERQRLNEAALVAGKNPETEAWIQRQLQKGKPQPEPVPKDQSLRMAVDFLNAWESLNGKIRVLQ